MRETGADPGPADSGRPVDPGRPVPSAPPWDGHSSWPTGGTWDPDEENGAQPTTALRRPVLPPAPAAGPPPGRPPRSANDPGDRADGRTTALPRARPGDAPPRLGDRPTRTDDRRRGPEPDENQTVPRARPRRPAQHRGAHLPPYQEPFAGPSRTSHPADPRDQRPLWSDVGTPATHGGIAGPAAHRAAARAPRKLTVTRVAAYRSRELTQRGVQIFHRATTADGADESGLAHLTYAVMGNYAVDAALTVALANTIFFADTGSTGKVLTYLLITVAPFAVVAPFIGPLLDRLQNGRRLALSVSSFGRALLAILMAFNFSPFNPWVIYPCALGSLVLSKAFSVLKAALTPRVLPARITLVKTNSRLTVFGLIAGGVAGLVAAGILKLTGSPGALTFGAVCAVAGGVLCLRIPAWVESTEGEVPVREVIAPAGASGVSRMIRTTLWANSMIRVETGFLALFIAFVVKNQYPTDHQQNSAFFQLLLLAVVGGAAGIGGFVGNALGARLNLSTPQVIAIIALSGTALATLAAAVVPGLATAAIVGFVGSTASSLAKVCLDSVIQHDLPEASRASAFGRSESVLQLAWVFGGVLGLLIGGVWFGHLHAVYSIGFGVISTLLAVGLVQCLLVRAGQTMLPPITLPRPRRRRTGPPGTPAAERRSSRSSTSSGSAGTHGAAPGLTGTAAPGPMGTAAPGPMGTAAPGPTGTAAPPAVDSTGVPAEPAKRRPRRAGSGR